MEPTDARAAVEEAIRVRLREQDFEQAYQLGMQAFGRELMGYLVVLLRDESAAREVYSELTERLWKSLPSFAFACSFRTWTYVLAWRSVSRYRRQKRRRREAPLDSSAPPLMAAGTRTSTALYRKTEAHSWLTKARAALAPAEQSLLTLRLDRGLSWDEVARVMALDAASARKRFERIKNRLREVAARDGLIPHE